MSVNERSENSFHLVDEDYDVFWKINVMGQTDE